MGKGIWGNLTSRAPELRPGTASFAAWRHLTRFNVAVWRATGGRLGGRFDAAPMCVLHHVGRKSGERRETPLVYLADGDDVIVMGSMGGAQAMPAWVHNLRARADAELELRGRRYAVVVREVDGPERDVLWPRLVEVWPAFADYQAKTDRKFPVFRLSPS